MNRRVKSILSIVLFAISIGAYSQSVWNRQQLEQVREHIAAPAYSVAYRQLIKEAEGLMNTTPVSVMMKKGVAASGDKHDYLSQARYYWPNPKSPNGLPYISHDGKSNPEIAELDRDRLATMCGRVQTLVLAWYFCRDERFAQKAVEQLRTWFLNKDTRMNPQMEYAQIVRGANGDKGRSYGLIDGYSFIEMLEAVQLLSESKSYTKQDDAQLKEWFSKFLNWYLNSEQGKGESRATNNHSLAYHVQVVAYALFCGNMELADKYINNFTKERVFKQIEPDGKQPRELRRTLAFGYSEFNLHHMIDLFLLARKRNMNIDDMTSPDGRNFYKAVDFLVPYVGQSKDKWPYQQISEWDEKQQDFCKDLYSSWILQPNRTDYLQLFEKYAKVSPADRWNLLFLHPEGNGSAIPSLDKQLKYAVESVNQALDTAENKQLVSPRTINKDGSLRMVVAKDWCSGFFPGVLWMMYQSTHEVYWKTQADKFTMPLQILSDYQGTHDLGFMVHNSFGQAWKATNDKKYLDVELQAVKALASRFDSTVGCIRSWDHHKERWTFPVIIDNMMNLEFLFWATQQTGDSTYYRMAVSHAQKTMRNHYRPDYSSYHVVDYNPADGTVRGKCTFQGYADESVWSRGQAWGLYGFTMCYRYTHDKAFLQQAEHIASFIFAQPNMPADLIPYWDMKDPQIPNSPRDVSAAAVTASALYELAGYSNQRAQYIKWADTIMDNLDRHYRAKTGSNNGFILLHSTGNYPLHDEIDKPIIYADYYYIEALIRKNNI